MSRKEIDFEQREPLPDEDLFEFSTNLHSIKPKISRRDFLKLASLAPGVMAFSLPPGFDGDPRAMHREAPLFDRTSQVVISPSQRIAFVTYGKTRTGWMDVFPGMQPIPTADNGEVRIQFTTTGRKLSAPSGWVYSDAYSQNGPVDKMDHFVHSDRVFPRFNADSVVHLSRSGFLAIETDGRVTGWLDPAFHILTDDGELAVIRDARGGKPVGAPIQWHFHNNSGSDLAGDFLWE